MYPQRMVDVDDSGNSIGANTGANEAETVDPIVSVEQPVPGSQVGLGRSPQFVTSACGTLPLSNAMHSIDISAPTSIDSGQLVFGRIEPDVPTNAEHFWNITLEPGFYNILVDTKRVDNNYLNLGVTLTDLNSLGVDDNVVLIDGDDINYRSRFHAFFEIKQMRTMTLRITPNFSAEDYIFGIFENGGAVPSPLFTDCPIIKTLSVDTTEALVVPENGSSAGDRWFLIDLESTDYKLNSSAVRTDGLASNITYQFSHVDQFGEKSRFANSSYVDGVEAVAAIDPVKVTKPVRIWMRLQNYNGELNLEFTLNTER